jgi:hypothetical protein
LVAIAALLVGALPAVGQDAPIVVGIDDEANDPDAPGVNVIREVASSNSVVVRLNNNFRTAKFRIVVRDVDVVGVDDDFPGSKGLEGDWEDGIVGPCRDDFYTNLIVKGNRTNVGRAIFYTCEGPDSVRVTLGEAPVVDDPSAGVDAAIRIVFLSEPDNVDGVFVGTDPTNVGQDWIPLYELQQTD